MARIAALDPNPTTGETRDLFEFVHAKLGMVPNMIREMANSPAVLDAYLQFSGALARGALGAKVRERIALAVAQANGSDYCLAAHTASGRMAGLTPCEIRDSRMGNAVDPKIDVLIRFARKIVDERGGVSDRDIAKVRAAGFDDSVITEVIAGVALSIFTSYFNNVADSKIDFPVAEPLQAPVK